MDSDIVRIFLAADTFPYVATGDCVSRIHRQVPRCTQAIHQVAAGSLRGKFACGVFPTEFAKLTGTFLGSLTVRKM